MIACCVHFKRATFSPVDVGGWWSFVVLGLVRDAVVAVRCACFKTQTRGELPTRVEYENGYRPPSLRGFRIFANREQAFGRSCRYIYTLRYRLASFHPSV